MNVQTCEDYTRNGPEKVNTVGGPTQLVCNLALATDVKLAISRILTEYQALQSPNGVLKAIEMLWHWRM
jgi:hypothetical protein